MLKLLIIVHTSQYPGRHSLPSSSFIFKVFCQILGNLLRIKEKINSQKYRLEPNCDSKSCCVETFRQVLFPYENVITEKIKINIDNILTLAYYTRYEFKMSIKKIKYCQY